MQKEWDASTACGNAKGGAGKTAHAEGGRHLVALQLLAVSIDCHRELDGKLDGGTRAAWQTNRIGRNRGEAILAGDIKLPRLVLTRNK